jgi:hypothetical protein
MTGIPFKHSFLCACCSIAASVGCSVSGFYVEVQTISPIRRQLHLEAWGLHTKELRGRCPQLSEPEPPKVTCNLEPKGQLVRMFRNTVLFRPRVENAFALRPQLPSLKGECDFSIT